MQMKEKDLTANIKKRVKNVGVDPAPYAQKSFRFGMACTVLENQRNLGDGVEYGDFLLEYIEVVGRWTNGK